MIRAGRMIAEERGSTFDFVARNDPRVPAVPEVSVRLQPTRNVRRNLEQPVYSFWNRLLASQLVHSDDQLEAAKILFEWLADELNIVSPEGPKYRPIDCS